ncbi:tRNA-processing RNAse BN [Ekhidna lutea]|uniref:tRNA-processing RNAse BN n=1 Tax=Ekhidna lutea TaxID=447679 RepID=A0A239LIV7_EKHLU|nr:YihY/virulence factor BrkB family protein [Ekhidna lutea]SNT30305.1 tRNA-processing RNAse BN [Ekhidna lutea]
MTKKLNQVRQFIEVDLWRLRLKSLPKRKRFLYGFIRVWVIAIKEFIADKCAEKASALTYLSMLSLVPVLALIFGIAKVFGIRELMEKELERYFSGQTEVLNQVQPFVDKMLDTQSGGIVVGASAVFLIYTVIRLLMNIENAFNDMWDIKKNRRWERKISDYVAVILLGPVLLIVASSSTLFVKDAIQGFVTNLEFLGQLKSGIIFLLKLLPYTILWFLLFGIYLIFPNTRVKFWPALFAGIVAGTLYQLNQQAFISLQFAFSRYHAIYGSIAFLPLFLIWLQISWLIVLFGAEICYGAQYINQWEMNSEKLKISLSHRKKLVLLLLYRIVKKFEKRDGQGPLTLNDLGGMVNIPRRYLADICYDLEKSGLIIRVEAEEVAYQPSFDIHKMDLFTILDKYEKEGMGDFDPRKTKAFVAIEDALEKIEDKWKSSESNVLLKDL